MNATVSPPPRQADMTPEEFRELLDSAGVKQAQAAEILGVTRRTIVRWLAGETPISPRNTSHIKATIRPNKKRK